jgi:hypothetical protein
MAARLVGVAFAWFAALVGLAAALHGSGSSHPPRPIATTALARSINDIQQTSYRRWRWTATSATSAVRTLVVHVEAVRVDDARMIAERIVEPRRAQYDEILVYVHRVGGSARLAPRRVEWSRRDGYVEMRYDSQ